jgi:hypothetical protein
VRVWDLVRLLVSWCQHFLGLFSVAWTMNDQAGPAARRPRYVGTLADKNWLLDYPEHNSKVNAVDLGTALARYRFALARQSCSHSRGQVNCR